MTIHSLHNVKIALIVSIQCSFVTADSGQIYDDENYFLLIQCFGECLCVV